MTPACMAGFPLMGAWLLAAFLTGCNPASSPPAPSATAVGGAIDAAGATGPTGATASPESTATAASPRPDEAQPTVPAPTGPGAEAPAGAPAAPAAAADVSASSPPAAPLPALAAEARVPGATVALSASGPTSVEPASTFEVRVGVPLRGARLVLLDAQDAMVPSASEAEVGPTIRITLVPEETLRPGSTYTLRLEGLTGRLLAGDGGAAYEPVAFALQTTGTPPPKPAPKKSRKRRGS